MPENQNELVEVSNRINEIIKEAGIKTAIIILENPSPTNDGDKLMVNLSGHHYDVTRMCCVVASKLKQQIASELNCQV